MFPSAPGLASIFNEKKYHNSLQKADLVFFDSSFFILLLRLFKNISPIRVSGYKFLRLYFNFLRKNKKSKIFLIDPSKKKSVNNKLLINKLGIKNNKIFSFVAPFYNPNNLNDKNFILKNFIKLIFQESNPSGIKYAMSLLNLCTNKVRLPLTEVSKELKSEIFNFIKSFKNN